MKFYIAARWANRERLRPIRDEIVRLGHEVTSTWIDKDLGDKYHQAMIDLRDIDRADILILWPDLQPDTTPTYGGCFYEAGYAFAKEKLSWLVDNTSPCIFTKHLTNFKFDSWDDVYKELKTVA